MRASNQHVNTATAMQFDEGLSRTGLAWALSAPLIGGLLFGYDIGVISYILAQWTSTSTNDDIRWIRWISDSPFLQGAMVSSSSFGALLGSMVLFVIADTIGRRKELQWSALCYGCGAMLQLVPLGMAHWKVPGILLFLIGRIVLGVGIGFALHGGPAYLGEMSPPSMRGALVTIMEACIVLGLLFGYIVGDAMSTTRTNELLIAMPCVIAPALLMGYVATRIVPESARWQLLQTPADRDAIVQSIRFLYPHHAERVFATLQQSVRNNDRRLSESPLSLSAIVHKLEMLVKPAHRRPLVAGAGLAMLQQLTGQPSILSFVAPILSTVGLSDHFSVAIGIFKLVVTLIMARLVETTGRRPLLVVGLGLMLISLLGMMVLAAETQEPMYTLIFLLIYMLGYQMGIGPITMIVNSEIFPSAMRATGIATSSQLSFLSHAMVQFLYPPIVDWFGLSTAFGGFACFAAIGIWFVYRCIPETQGRSLEAIEREMRGSDEAATDGNDDGQRTRRGQTGDVETPNEDVEQCADEMGTSHIEDEYRSLISGGSS